MERVRVFVERVRVRDEIDESRTLEPFRKVFGVRTASSTLFFTQKLDAPHALELSHR
jgi:hypothetical protein